MYFRSLPSTYAQRMLSQNYDFGASSTCEQYIADIVADYYIEMEISLKIHFSFDDLLSNGLTKKVKNKT